MNEYDEDEAIESRNRKKKAAQIAFFSIIGLIVVGGFAALGIFLPEVAIALGIVFGIVGLFFVLEALWNYGFE